MKYFLFPLVSLLLFAACSNDSSSFPEINAEIQSGQLRLLDLNNTQLRNEIMELLSQAGDSPEQSPQLFERLSGNFGAGPLISADNPLSNLRTGISEQLFSSDGRFSYHSEFDTDEKLLVLVSLFAVFDKNGTLVSAPHFVEDFDLSSEQFYASESMEITALSEGSTAVTLFIGETTAEAFFAVLGSVEVDYELAREQQVTKVVSSREPLVGSVLAGTVVQLADKTEKPIEEVSVGDVLTLCDLAANSCSSEGTVSFSVSGTVSNAVLVSLRTKSGLEIKATRQHPFQLSSSKTVFGSMLKPGDNLQLEGGKTDLVQSVQFETVKKSRVHSLSFASEAPMSGYIANKVVVGDYKTQLGLADSLQDSRNEPDIGSQAYERDKGHLGAS